MKLPSCRLCGVSFDCKDFFGETIASFRKKSAHIEFTSLQLLLLMLRPLTHPMSTTISFVLSRCPKFCLLSMNKSVQKGRPKNRETIPQLRTPYFFGLQLGGGFKHFTNISQMGGSTSNQTNFQERIQLSSTTLVDCWDVFLCAGASGQYPCHGICSTNDAQLPGWSLFGTLAPVRSVAMERWTWGVKWDPYKWPKKYMAIWGRILTTINGVIGSLFIKLVASRGPTL